MNDVGEELLEKIRADFALSTRQLLKTECKSQRDIEKLSEKLGQALSKSVRKYVKPEKLPNGRLYYNIADTILRNTLHDNYELINSIEFAVQKEADKVTGLNIEPQKAPFPDERVNSAVNAVSVPDISSELLDRRLDSPIRNIINSFHVDYVENNAEFRSNAGIKCYITRTTDGKCCPWCTSIAGRYEYGKEPSNIYRRHDNCTCSVTFENGRERQNVWSKRKWEVKDEFQPKVFSRQQAERIQSQNLNFRGLTNGENRGIIEEKEVEYGVPYGERSVDADMDYINSDDYASIFDNISDNPAVNKTLLECARKSIDHRNGTKFEDMYFIHAETGEVLAEQVEMTYPSGISYNDDIKALLKRSKEEGIPLVTIHNHPEGYPPSVDDLNKSYENGTVFGIATGHNGQVYKYNNPGKKTENAGIIHDNIAILCMGGADPDRIYTAEFSNIGLHYDIIK